uniref:DUF3631 domain-containing protein n=1 Tax=Geobacter sp. (strain M21) TaxID=443144 RepID=C6E2B9_GEOSM
MQSNIMMPTPNMAASSEASDELVKRLAELSEVQYDQVRKEQAKVLGIRPSTLDAAIKKARKPSDTAAILFEEVEPSPMPVDPGILLSDLRDTIRRFVVCTEQAAIAGALWIAMTWFIDVVSVAPLAVITAPEKRCGKSILLGLFEKLTMKPLAASNITPAAFFRAIDAWSPTLLIDEADAFMKDNEELRGLLNSGHTRASAYVIRTVGDNFTPTKFNTWGAKALAGIGNLPGTVMDRSIVLELRRKLATETVERLRYADEQVFKDLKGRLARVREDYMETLHKVRPPLPAQLNDRAMDNWEPLLQIAMLGGEAWFETATKAAIKIAAKETGTITTGTQLLVDIRDILNSRSSDRISSQDLIDALCLDAELLWSTYNRGRAISTRQLAMLLKLFGIHSKTIRYNNSTAKGYEAEQFLDAFFRYIPPVTLEQ